MRSGFPGFPGFPQEAITFYKGLTRNNTREWFQPRKHIYDERVKAPMVELAGQLNQAMMEFAPHYVTDPGKAIYRIYRDTRFSPDKTPYKTHIAASFWHRKHEKHACAGYYFSVSHKEVEVAGGVYMPGPEQLLAIRQYLAEHSAEFQKSVNNRKLVALMEPLKGESLSRVPKGFRTDHPAADLIRMKQWLFYTSLDPAVATKPTLYGEVVERFRAMQPVIELLNRPLAHRTAKVVAADMIL